MTQHHPRRPQQEGFTMVVMAALFVAFTIIASVLVERTSVTQLMVSRDQTVDQMTRISNAIIEYSVANKSGTTLLYPCPAADNVAPTTAGFGAEILNCHNTTVAGTTLLNGDTLRGMVPVQALAAYGIGAGDAFDAWGNRLMYVVNRRLTFGTPGPSATVAQANNPVVTNPITGVSIPSPDFLLISYGKDGLGATKRGMTSISNVCTNATTTPRYENCDLDASFYSMPTFTTRATGATYFDDVLTYFRQ